MAPYPESSDEKLAFLAEASRELVQVSVHYEATLECVASLAIPALADWCFVDLREEDGSLRRAAIADGEDAMVEVLRDLALRSPLDLDASEGPAGAIRTGKPLIYPDISGDLLGSFASGEEFLAVLRGIRLTSALVVPLTARGQILGSLSLFTTGTRRFGPSDVSLAEELAFRCAMAIDNARHYRNTEIANRLKDEFLSTLSHELRTPLNAMLGWLWMLRTGQLTPKAQARALETVERNAKTQARLIENLLDLSRIMSGSIQLDREPIALATVVASAVDALREAAEQKRVQMDVDLGMGVAVVLGDRERLVQVVSNLLSNAIKFTPAGGHIEVELTTHQQEVYLEIRDNGVGIASNTLPNLFDRFHPSTDTRRPRKPGLGLALVRELVELHGGVVYAESAGLGRGATFTVTLPLHAPDRTSQPEEVWTRAAEPRLDRGLGLEGTPVLVVEDDRDTLDLLKAVLEQCGAVVTTASSAAQAFSEFERVKPKVLVSDIGMSEEDGYSLIRRIRALPPERGGTTPAVALTAFARKEDRAQALASGFQAHVAKPVEPDQFVRVVAKLKKKG